MLVDRITALAERFLSEPSFRLIVAPAVADFQFDRESGAPVGGHMAVVCAVAGAVYEDVTSDPGNAFTFLALALIPACYYAFLFMLCAPAAPLRALVTDSIVLVLGGAVLLLSAAPAIICYWPERLPVRPSTETP